MQLMTSFEWAHNRSLLTACLQQVFAEVSSLLPGLETGAFMYIIVDVYTFLEFLEFRESSCVYIYIYVYTHINQTTIACVCIYIYMYIYMLTLQP